MCALDAEAHRIMAGSSLEAYRTEQPGRARKTARLLNEVVGADRLDGELLDIGPGLYHFGLLARARGGRTTGVERDDAHCALGRHLGFTVVQGDWFEGVDPGGPFDGVWMKNVEYRSGYGREDLDHFVAALDRLIAPGGWSLVVLRNGRYPIADGDAVPEPLLLQRQAFEDAGWRARPLTDDLRRRFGLKVKGAPWFYTRGLDA